MEASCPVQAARPATLRLQSLVASAGLVALACVAYRFAPFDFHRKQFAQLYGVGEYRFTGGEFLFWAAATYVALLACYCAFVGNAAPSKALRAWRVVVRFTRAPRSVAQAPLPPEDRVALLACALKAFFAPLMVMSLMVFCSGLA